MCIRDRHKTVRYHNCTLSTFNIYGLTTLSGVSKEDNLSAPEEPAGWPWRIVVTMRRYDLGDRTWYAHDLKEEKKKRERAGQGWISCWKKWARSTVHSGSWIDHLHVNLSLALSFSCKSQPSFIIFMQISAWLPLSCARLLLPILDVKRKTSGRSQPRQSRFYSASNKRWL